MTLQHNIVAGALDTELQALQLVKIKSNMQFIKRPNQLTSYTSEQILELRKCALDPVYFITNYIKVQHPLKGSMPFNLYPYQKKCVKAFQENRWVITLQSRQSGKTTVIAAYILWYATFNSDKSVLVASNKNNNAIEIMARIKYAYEELPDWLKAGCNYYTKHSMEFDNGSRVWSEATTETTGRGKAISLLMLDELAFVPGKIQEQMWSSIAPTLSTGGSCIISSTPNGDQELFSRLWNEAKLGVNSLGGDENANSFFPVEVHWTEHPDRGDAFKAEMLNKLGETKWRQEFENEFLSSDDLLINTRVLQFMRYSTPQEVDRGFKIWKQPTQGKTYVIGVDLAEGLGKDFSTIQVVELESMEQIMEYRNNKINETQLYNALKYIMTRIEGIPLKQGEVKPVIYWSFENNSIGAAMSVLYYNDENFPENPELVSPDKKLGMNTSAKTKAMACRTLKKLIEKQKGNLKLNSELLIMELKNFIQKGGSFAAKNGATDDLVSAMLIVVRVIDYLSTQETEIFEKIYDTEQDFYDENTDEFAEPIGFVL